MLAEHGSERRVACRRVELAELPMASSRPRPSVGRVSIDDGTSRIGSDPFATPLEEREPARRLWGRLWRP